LTTDIEGEYGFRLKRVDVNPFSEKREDISISSLYCNNFDIHYLLRHFDLYTKDDNDNITKVNDIIQQKLDDDYQKRISRNQTSGGKRKTIKCRKNKSKRKRIITSKRRY
jgi:hypothetical protein